MPKLKIALKSDLSTDEALSKRRVKNIPPNSLEMVSIESVFEKTNLCKQFKVFWIAITTKYCSDSEGKAEIDGNLPQQRD